MLRRTKIVATLGPASSDQKVLEKMIQAGVDVVRMNFSHGSAKDHVARVEKVRAAAAACGRIVGILADLQGPKIRVGKIENDKIMLKQGDTFILDAEWTGLGNQERVGLDYKDLPKDVSKGSVLLLNDGMLEFDVIEVKGAQVICKVVCGGILSNNKGINRKGGGLTAPALTDKDKKDIKTAALIQADYLAVSFPRSAEDMKLARRLMHEAGGKSLLMAKIERAEAIGVLDEIIDASDAIMVARGDLSVEVGDAAVPGLQKRMIRMARAKKQAGGHRHPDDGIHDHQSDPYPRGSFRCSQRRAGWNRCRHAFRRNRSGRLSDRNGQVHGSHLHQGGKRDGGQRNQPPPAPEEILAHRPVHRHVRALCGLALQCQGDCRADAIRLDDAVDVAHECAGTHLCTDADRIHPEQGDPVQRRASNLVRHHLRYPIGGIARGGR